VRPGEAQPASAAAGSLNLLQSIGTGRLCRFGRSAVWGIVVGCAAVMHAHPGWQRLALLSVERRGQHGPRAATSAMRVAARWWWLVWARAVAWCSVASDGDPRLHGGLALPGDHGGDGLLLGGGVLW
jgi:hypothetical protein